ncbi:MAG: hypothetical protein H7257_00625 [Taibaiella sp.]|nr:hypothetical protein [Taibaiella sp.]
MTDIDIEQILNEFEAKGEFQEIVNYCTALIDSGVANNLIYGARGNALRELGIPDDAILDITKAIQFCSDHAFNFAIRGNCYSKIDKIPLAIADYTKAIELDNKYLFALTERGLCYLQMNEFQKAIEDYDIVIKADGEADDYFCRGICYSNIDEHILAIDDYTKAIEIAEDENVDYFEYRSSSYHKLKIQDKALQDFERCIALLSNASIFIKKIKAFNDIDGGDHTPDNHNNASAGIKNTHDLYLALEGKGFIINPHNVIGFPFENSSGLYIIEFDNNEFYIGQTKEIRKRYKAHLNNYKNIKNFFFLSLVASELLLQSHESQLIAWFEQNLLRIKNLKQIKFENIFCRDYQKKWISNLEFNYVAGIKYFDPETRSKYSAKFQLLQQKGYFQSLCSILSQYIKEGIPNYLGSEFNYWSVSCLPVDTFRENIISRVNICSVPVLSAYIGSDDTVKVMLLVSILPFIDAVNSKFKCDVLFANVPSLSFDLSERFEIAEGDLIALFIDADDFEAAINNSIILKAIRLLNLRMMNKVGAEEKHTRNRIHCLDLSDYIFEKIGIPFCVNLK